MSSMSAMPCGIVRAGVHPSVPRSPPRASACPRPRRSGLELMARTSCPSARPPGPSPDARPAPPSGAPRGMRAACASRPARAATAGAAPAYGGSHCFGTSSSSACGRARSVRLTRYWPRSPGAPRCSCWSRTRWRPSLEQLSFSVACPAARRASSPLRACLSTLGITRCMGTDARARLNSRCRRCEPWGLSQDHPMQINPRPPQHVDPAGHSSRTPASPAGRAGTRLLVRAPGRRLQRDGQPGLVVHPQRAAQAQLVPAAGRVQAVAQPQRGRAAAAARLAHREQRLGGRRALRHALRRPGGAAGWPGSGLCAAARSSSAWAGCVQPLRQGLPVMHACSCAVKACSGAMGRPPTAHMLQAFAQHLHGSEAV